MGTLREWIARLWGTLRKNRPDRDLEEELRHHLDLAAEDAQRRGSTPEGALRAATLEVGAIPQVMETLRDQRGLLWLEHLARDLRYACRLFMKTPGFTIVAISSLALGIGANTAIFSVVHSVLLEPLPYNKPDRLVRIIQNLPATVTIDARPRRVAAMDLNELLDLRRRTQTFSQVATYDSSSEMTLMGGEEPIRVVGTPVSPSLFPALGTQPFLGRVFHEDEEKPGSPQTVILSHATWRNYFASDPMILNRTVTLNGRSHAVIGVMPRRDLNFPIVKRSVGSHLTRSGDFSSRIDRLCLDHYSCVLHTGTTGNQS